MGGASQKTLFFGVPFGISVAKLPKPHFNLIFLKNNLSSN
jgi:hypothetical protein